MLSRLQNISRFLAVFSGSLMLFVALHGVLHLHEHTQQDVHCTLCEVQALDGFRPVLPSFLPFSSYLKVFFISPKIHEVLSIVPHADLRGPPLS